MSSPVDAIFIVGGIVGSMALSGAKKRRRQAQQRERRRIEAERTRQRAAEQKRKQAERAQKEAERFQRQTERQWAAEQRAIENQRKRELAEQRRIEERKAREAQKRREQEERRRIAEQEARELRLRQEQELREWESSKSAQRGFQSFAENSMKSRLLNQMQLARNLIAQFDDMFDGYMETADILEEETGNDNELQEMVQNLHEEIIYFLQHEHYSDADTVDSLEEKRKKFEDKLSQIQRMADRIEHMAEQNNQDLFAIMSEKIGSASFEEIDVDFSDDEPEIIDDFNELKTSILDALADLEETPELPENLQRRISSSKKQIEAFENIQLLRNFRALTLIPLASEISAFKKKYEVYSDLRLEYEAMCVLRGIQPVKTNYSAAMIPFLKSEIDNMENEMTREDEQEYIHQCLDEVMAEMGYEVIGHRNVKKKSGKKFTNDLYSFSDGTAVNITSSSDGMISMEFGGIDTVDRIPDETERISLAEEAGTFCEKQKEIESRLEEKGVLVGKRISILPPDGAYAQIINISDYDLEKEPERFEVRKKKRSADTNKKRIGE